MTYHPWPPKPPSVSPLHPLTDASDLPFCSLELNACTATLIHNPQYTQSSSPGPYYLGLMMTPLSQHPHPLDNTVTLSSLAWLGCGILADTCRWALSKQVTESRHVSLWTQLLLSCQCSQVLLSLTSAAMITACPGLIGTYASPSCAFRLWVSECHASTPFSF
jgi:hypothetical protein